jgi:hypothetical protein
MFVQNLHRIQGCYETKEYKDGRNEMIALALCQVHLVYSLFDYSFVHHFVSGKNEIGYQIQFLIDAQQILSWETIWV